MTDNTKKVIWQIVSNYAPSVLNQKTQIKVIAPVPGRRQATVAYTVKKNK
jgi:hypothetical protein